MLNEKKLVKEIIDSGRKVEDIFFVACGGSMNDLFSAHYFVEKESERLH